MPSGRFADPGSNDGYWNAHASQPLPSVEALREDADCDVAVIGAGFTGLSAAHHLDESGTSCIVLEAGELGCGGSGRTAGMAGTRYKKGWAALAAEHGTEQALGLHQSMRDAHATLRELLDAYEAHDALVVGGQLIPAHTPEILHSLEADADWLRREAGDTAISILDAQATESATGARGYLGAWLDPRGGALQPVDFLRSVARGMLARGMRIHVRSPVFRIDEGQDSVLLTTPSGRVRAREVIVATNAYTPSGWLEPDLSRHLVQVASSVIVTEPLPPDIADTILPGGRVASDTKRLLHAFRLLPDRRLLFSGRADITGRRSEDPRSYAMLERAMRETFPQVALAKVEHRWAGFVGVSRDGFPHLGRLSRRQIYAMGYSGRGVVLSHLLGRHAAGLALGKRVDLGPMNESGFRPWPFHGLRIPAMRAAAWFYDVQDRRESARLS